MLPWLMATARLARAKPCLVTGKDNEKPLDVAARGFGGVTTPLVSKHGSAQASWAVAKVALHCLVCRESACSLSSASDTGYGDSA
jgi:hypothetical protein